VIRLAYVVSHPIQYQAPLLRRIAQEPDIDLQVFFGSDFSVRAYDDRGFGVAVKWDVPLLEGYRHQFLPALRDNGAAGPMAPISRGLLRRLRGRHGAPFDALWVHGYATVNALHAIVAAKSLGIPVLLRAESWAGDHPRTWATLAAKRLFFNILRPMIDGALAIGTLNAAYWRHYLGAGFPIFSMPYAVDNAYFQQRSEAAAAGRTDFQASLGLDPARPVILFASKLQSRKHCDHLIEAYLKFTAPAGPTPPPYLLIVGDGEQRPVLEQQVKQAGREDDIRFLGFRNQSELPRFFDLASVFVLPSRHEPWGLIVNEVMNAGRAVIVSSEAGCQPDLVTDGMEGCVFPAGNVDALADALHRVFRTPETAPAMGERALQRIRTWSFEEDVRGLRQALAAVTRKIVP